MPGKVPPAQAVLWLQGLVVPRLHLTGLVVVEGCGLQNHAALPVLASDAVLARAEEWLQV